MTPLCAALTRRLPRPAALAVTVLVYAGLLVAIFVAIGVPPPDVIYIDVPDADR